MKRPQLPPAWRVLVDAHELPPRWHVPARAVQLAAPDAEFAIWRVISWAQSDAGVPPMRSFVRASSAFASARPVGGGGTVAELPRREPAQLKLLDDRRAA